MTNTQDEPMQDGNHATDSQKLQGIAGQVRADISLHHEGDVRLLLEQRLHDAGLELSPAEFELLLSDVTDEDQSV
jgi:hypothetical protein